ncbi:histidinol-phosphate transaminase [Brucella sp. C7-11G]
MVLINDRKIIIYNIYDEILLADDIGATGNYILSWDQLTSLTTTIVSTRRVGVKAPAGLTAKQLAPYLKHLDLIIVDFSIPKEERSFLLADTLRNDLEFKGDIRAAGQVHPNGFEDLVQSGFTSIQIPDNQSLDEWLISELHEVSEDTIPPAKHASSTGYLVFDSGKMDDPAVSLERAHIKKLDGYVPGFQPKFNAIKLNTNENPYPPSPRVMAALRQITERSLRLYPDPLSTEFRNVAAELHGVGAENIVATNGGDELLRLVLTTFVDPGRAVGIVAPSYGVYRVLTTIHEAKLSIVNLTNEWTLPIDAAERWNADGAQVALLSNPHAPSGVMFSQTTLEELATKFNGILLIDEAYIDFVDSTYRFNGILLTKRFPNVIVLRTLSKGYSLAGVRLAYGVAKSVVISPILDKTKDSYNVDAISQQLGTAALIDFNHARANCARISQERAILKARLNELGVEVQPSQANFLLASFPPSGWTVNARSLKDKLEDERIYVRWFDEEGLRDKLRISIGASADNYTFLSVLEKVLNTRC